MREEKTNNAHVQRDKHYALQLQQISDFVIQCRALEIKEKKRQKSHKSRKNQGKARMDGQVKNGSTKKNNRDALRKNCANTYNKINIISVQLVHL